MMSASPSWHASTTNLNLDGMDRGVKIMLACTFVLLSGVIWVDIRERGEIAQDEAGNGTGERGLNSSLLLMACFVLFVLTALLALACTRSRSGYSAIGAGDTTGADGTEHLGTEAEQHRAQRQRAELLARNDGGEGNIFITNRDL